MKTELPIIFVLLISFAIGWFLVDLIEGMIILIITLTIFYGA